MTKQWNLKIVSINVNGISSDMWSKLRALHKARYDVITLQETKLKDAKLNDDLHYKWKQVTDGEVYSAPAATSQAGGVAILLSSYACTVLQNRSLIPITIDQHRHIILNATLYDQNIYIHSVYAPVRRLERPPFFSQLTIPTRPGSHIIAGDFNCVIDAQIDTRGDPHLAGAGSTELISWLATMGAVDAWRLCNDDSQEFTSPSGTSRIDMIFISGCFTNNYSAQHSPRIIGSDHLAPIVTTASSNMKAGGGHWQMPSWLARGAAKRINPTLVNLASSTSDPNYHDTFTKVMKKVTGLCMATHKQVLRARKDKLDRARLRWLRAHYAAVASPTGDLIAQAVKARSEWLQEVETEGRRKRAWAFDKHFAEAERCSAFFLRRPRKKNVATIPGIKRSNGTVSNDPEHIQTHHCEFWSKLYSADSGGAEATPTATNIQNLVSMQLPRLTDEAALSLEAEISEDEVIKQINRLPLNKAAGADGLRAELFKQAPKLWAKILQPILETHLHQQRQLPQPFRESIIILLHKKGCVLQPKNYRPIALLNVMGKILSGIHNDRLRRVLDQIIPPEQTGFVPNRSISENIILLQDAIFYAKRHHPSSIVLSLDFEKAYDRVQWRVMHAILRKMNFGQRWRNVIATMYRDRTAKLSINGELTNPFSIERGVLQGDPLSPALFILQCSPLYATLNAKRAAHGIPLPNNSCAPVATFYADDTNIIARSPESAVALYDAAEWFSSNSGAKIHPGKCTAIPTGPAPPRLSNGITILQPHQDTTILGIPMGMNISRQQQTQRVLAKMIGRCSDLSHVGRTVEGRVNVVRAMALSTILYVLGALPTDLREAKKVQNLVYNFLNNSEEYEWDGPTKRGNMARQWFHHPAKLGGWGLTPVVRSLRTRKLALLRAFLKDSSQGKHRPWHTFIPHMLNEHMRDWGTNWRSILFWNGTQVNGDFSIGKWGALSPWWREAWQLWIKLRCSPKKNSFDRRELLRWPVWNNRLLMTHHGVNTALYRAFLNTETRAHMRAVRLQGFLTFNDFANPNGSIMSGQELYTAVTVRLSVNDSDHIVPISACESLSRMITAMWANTTKNWLTQSSHPSQHNTNTWAPQALEGTPFTTATNAAITKLVADFEPPTTQLNLIKLNGQPISVSWSKERSMLSTLAPTRRDLLKRLTRNALPLGSKRVHWHTECQTSCLLCGTNALETAKHLFWECSYAVQTWGRLHRPWRNHRRSAIRWEEVLLGQDARLGTVEQVTAERLWSIVRGGVIRSIWLERNRRYFYPELAPKEALFRFNMAKDDIKTHIESWHRRAQDEEKHNVCSAIDFIKHREPVYHELKLNLTPIGTNNTTTLPHDIT